MRNLNEFIKLNFVMKKSAMQTTEANSLRKNGLINNGKLYV